MTLHHSDAQLCRQCGGLCCRGHAGVWVDPRRFLASFFAGRPFDREALPAGIVLRDLGGVPVPAPKTLEQGCIFLTASGCGLDLQQRPCQCLALHPELDTLLDGEIRCRLPSACGSQAARNNWRRFWRLSSETGGDEHGRDHAVPRVT